MALPRLSFRTFAQGYAVEKGPWAVTKKPSETLNRRGDPTATIPHAFEWLAGKRDDTGKDPRDGVPVMAVNPDLVAAARALRLDGVAGVAISRLRAAGVASILLKGPTIASWLYTDGETRPYWDIDLLISPANLETAKLVLAAMGFVHTMRGAHPAEVGPREQELFGPDGVCIDLHIGLLGVDAPEQRCWEVLVQHTEPFRLPGGVEATALDLPARTMHLALHVAQNGPIDVKALGDLERGVGRVDREGWRAAAELATELDAIEAFAAGLRLVPQGAALADELSLTRRMTVELALRTHSAPQTAIFFERLAGAPGARKKVTLLARKLFPTAVWLRANSGLARRGRLGLLCARGTHPWSVLRRFPGAFLEWRAARRATGERP